MKPLAPREPPERLARLPIGAALIFDGGGGIVVETKAHDIDDPASHAFACPPLATRRCLDRRA